VAEISQRDRGTGVASAGTIEQQQELVNGMRWISLQNSAMRSIDAVHVRGI
jgi:hypothetical protein